MKKFIIGFIVIFIAIFALNSDFARSKKTKTFAVTADTKYMVLKDNGSLEYDFTNLQI